MVKELLKKNKNGQDHQYVVVDTTISGFCLKGEVETFIE